MWDYLNVRPPQMQPGDPDDLYAVLGVSSTATSKQIKAAYRQLAKRTHPDMNASPAARQRFHQVTQAYYTLGDPGKRSTYDQGRFLRKVARNIAVVAFATTTEIAIPLVKNIADNINKGANWLFGLGRPGVEQLATAAPEKQVGGEGGRDPASVAGGVAVLERESVAGGEAMVFERRPGTVAVAAEHRQVLQETPIAPAAEISREEEEAAGAAWHVSGEEMDEKTMQRDDREKGGEKVMQRQEQAVENEQGGARVGKKRRRRRASSGAQKEGAVSQRRLMLLLALEEERRAKSMLNLSKNEGLMARVLVQEESMALLRICRDINRDVKAREEAIAQLGLADWQVRKARVLVADAEDRIRGYVDERQQVVERLGRAAILERTTEQKQRTAVEHQMRIAALKVQLVDLVRADMGPRDEFDPATPTTQAEAHAEAEPLTT